MIWRIRAKQRQPNFVHNGATDHADRLGPSGINGELSHTTSQRLLLIERFSASCHEPLLSVSSGAGEWMEFEQDEPPYFPGEEGNDPFERSKFALAHIWHEVRARICTKLCSLKKASVG